METMNLDVLLTPTPTPTPTNPSMETMNLDGLDIDLEGSAVASAASLSSVITSLISDHGKVVTAAPEAAQGPLDNYASILPLLSWVHPQYYNNGPNAVTTPYVQMHPNLAGVDADSNIVPPHIDTLPVLTPSCVTRAAPPLLPSPTGDIVEALDHLDEEGPQQGRGLPVDALLKIAEGAVGQLGPITLERLRLVVGENTARLPSTLYVS